jgi:hypothetical protein
MRILTNLPTTIFLAILPLSGAYGQVQDGNSSQFKHAVITPDLGPEGMRLQMVETALREGDPALAVGAFHVHQMGDEAAVNIIRIIGMRGTLTLTDTEQANALKLVEKAFEEPTMIATPINFQPRATLFLLQVLETGSAGSGLKGRIAEVRDHIRGSLEKAAPGGATPGKQ